MAAPHCFVNCSFHDLYEISSSILVPAPTNFFSKRVGKVHLLKSCSSCDLAIAGKMLWYLFYFLYTMDSSSKEITLWKFGGKVVAVLHNSTNPKDGAHFGRLWC